MRQTVKNCNHKVTNSEGICVCLNQNSFPLSYFYSFRGLRLICVIKNLMLPVLFMLLSNGTTVSLRQFKAGRGSITVEVNYLVRTSQN